MGKPVLFLNNNGISFAADTNGNLLAGDQEGANAGIHNFKIKPSRSMPSAVHFSNYFF